MQPRISFVSPRRGAEKLGLKRQIVHYYFHTVLFVAVIRRDAEEPLVTLSNHVAVSGSLRRTHGSGCGVAATFGGSSG